MRFILESVLRARDELSKPAVTAFGRVQDAGDRVARRIGKRLAKELSGKALANKLKGLAMAGGVLAGGAAYGLKQASDKFVEISDSMAKTARFAASLGLDEALLGAIQAKGAEKGIENLDDIIRSIEELMLRYSELKSDTGSLKGFLDGIKAKGLANQFKEAKTSTDALKLALSALTTETNEANRVALADALFGGNDAALDLRNLFTGTEELEAFLKDIEATSGATSEQYKEVAKLAAARAKLSGTFGAMGRELTGKLAPSVRRVVKTIEAWVWANEELIDQRLGDLVEWISKKLDKLTTKNIGEWFTELVEESQDAARALLSFARGAVEVARTLIDWGRRVTDLARTLGLDAQNLATVAAAFFAAWSIGRIVALGGAMLKLAKDAAGVVKQLRMVARTAGPAGRALSAALTFTGAIGGALTLASLLATVIERLTGIEDFAERHVRHDIGSQAESLKEEIEALKKRRADLVKDYHQTRAALTHRGPKMVAQMEAIDAKIDAKRGERETIEAVARIESGGVAGDEVARKQLAEVLGGSRDLDKADALTESVKAQGGNAGDLRVFIEDEIDRRIEEEDAARAQSNASEAIRRKAEEVNPPAPGYASLSTQEMHRALVQGMQMAVREMQGIGEGIRQSLSEQQQLHYDQRTRMNLGIG